MEVDLTDLTIEEYVKGIRYNNDGTYELNDQALTNEEIMQKFSIWEQFGNSVLLAFLNPSSVSLDEAGNMVSTLYIQSAFDEFGQIIKQLSICPVCHKKQDFVNPIGYCSLECFAKDFAKYLVVFEEDKEQKKTTKLLERISRILDFLNLVMNVIMEIPTLLQNIAMLPPKYRDYCIKHLNIMFLKMRIVINHLLTEKAMYIIQILRLMTSGIIEKSVMAMFDDISTIIEMTRDLRSMFENLYASAIKPLQSPITGGIEPESMAFILTPRSIQRADTRGKITIQVPKNTNKYYAFDNADFDALNKFVNGIFPPIQPEEFYIDPIPFKARALFSPHSNLRKKVYKFMQNFLVHGGDLLPAYENLNFKNIWFILTLLADWGPVTQKIFGDWMPGRVYY